MLLSVPGGTSRLIFPDTVTVPDLPGCVAVGETKAEAQQLIQEAIEFHLEGMREEGLTIPEPASISELVEVAA